MSDHKEVVALPQPAAPSEPAPTREQPYTHRYIVVLKPAKGHTEIAGCANVINLVKDKMAGAGNVSLYKLELMYAFTKKGHSISAGIANANLTLTEDEVAMSPEGLFFQATEMGPYEKRTEELVVPDTLSRQIQPVSSMLPGWKLHIHASEGVKVSVAMYVKVHGPITERLSLSFPI